jgi:hypothetical protein
MQNSRFTDSQIAFIPRQAEEGTSVEEAGGIFNCCRYSRRNHPPITRMPRTQSIGL